MAKTSSITIKLGGVALEGAEVFSTAQQVVKITDADGKITGSFPDAYATVAFIAVRHASMPYTFVAMMVLEAGEDYELNMLPVTGSPPEGYDPYLGLHCEFVNKL